MTTFDDAVKEIKQHDAGFQTALESWPAYLGDGEGSVIGSDKSHYHCRYPTSESPAVEVFANGCPPVDGMRVTVGYSADQPKLIKVLSWTDPDLDNLTTPLQYHADQHAYLAGDTVWVDWRQITALKVQPFTGLTVYVHGGVLPRSGVDTLVVPQTVNLTGHTPASSGLARYCLLSLDTSGVVAITDGSDVATLSLDIADVPATPTGNFRLAAVALTYGQTTIEESITRTDILDLRWPQETIAGYLSPGQVTLARGSLIIGNASGVGAEYVLGAANKVLQSNGTDAIWSNFTLTISGNSTINGSLVGNITGGGTLATGGFTITVPATGTAALGAGTLTVSTTNNVTGATHTHAITSSSNPGAAASILASDASGYLQLTGLGIGSAASAARRFYINTTVTDHTTTTFGANINHTKSISSNDGNQNNGLSISFYNGGTANYTSINSALFGGIYHNSTGTGNQIIGLYYTTGAAGTTVGNVISAIGVRVGRFSFGAGGLAAIIATSTGLQIDNQSAYNTPTTAYGINILDNITATGTNKYGLNIGNQSGATNNYSIYGNSGLYRFGDQLSIVGSADRTQLTVTGFTTQTNTLAQFTRNDGNTSAVVTMLTATVNTTGTAAAGFGGAIALNLESSTTADQAAAAIDWLWTDATHASRTALYRGKTTGNATNTGYYGHWNHSAVAGSAITVIPNATGDVTEIATFVYAVAEVTGTGTSGGTVTVTPGGGAVTLYSDGTDTLQLTCAADGSVTVQRSAGTDTFKVSLWGTWL